MLFLLFAAAAHAAGPASVLKPEYFRHYVDGFNAMIDEPVVNYIPNAQAWEWMASNIPLLACPDLEVEKTYYYRWWAFRKHIKQTPAGFIVTEFIRPVKHATDYNAVSSALSHHIYEGRWLKDVRYMDQYLNFWLRSGENGGLQRHLHNYSGWTADAAYARWLVDGRRDYATSLLDALILDYTTWERDRLLPSGLFWQFDVRDGMEDSASGSRKEKNARPTINSYMYGNARAIAEIARLAGKLAVANEYERKAARLRELVQKSLWDSEAKFFKPLLESGKFAEMREQMGFTPWYFDLPDAGRGYEAAWKQLMDPKGFFAPFGPTTVEQRHPAFRIADTGDDCQWNGPAWPFATTVTLKALANVLNDYKQDAVKIEDYFKSFLVYTRSQRLKLPDGGEIPFVDENQNPLTGEWQARTMKIGKGKFEGRGDHYNHSGYGDLLITGLVGLRPRADSTVEVNPLIPSSAWEWFCLDNVSYHGRTLTIVWDRDGRKFGKGSGLRVFADGREIGRNPRLERTTARLGP